VNFILIFIEISSNSIKIIRVVTEQQKSCKSMLRTLWNDQKTSKKKKTDNKTKFNWSNN